MFILARYFSKFLDKKKMTETLPAAESDEPKYFVLRININGFKLEDVKVEIVDSKEKDSASNQIHKNKVQLKISATRTQSVNKQESTSEYAKFYDIPVKHHVDVNTMRYYLDKKNPFYLNVEFESKSNENVYINLDDSCESLVEMAAKSLLNIKNIEDLKNSIENPTSSNFNFEEVFSASILKDLSQSTKTTFSPIRTIENADGSKLVRVDVSIPFAIKTVSIVDKIQFDPNNNHNPNHLFIKPEGVKIYLDALTTSDTNTTSTFSKVLKVPKGTLTNKTRFKFDQTRHLLVLEAPFSH